MYTGFEAEVARLVELHTKKFEQYGTESIDEFGPSYLIMRLCIKAGKLKRFICGRSDTVNTEEELQDIAVTAILALAAMRNGLSITRFEREK